MQPDNILIQFENLFNNDTLNKISGFVDIKKSCTKQTLDSSADFLLAACIDKATSESGAKEVLHLIKDTADSIDISEDLEQNSTLLSSGSLFINAVLGVSKHLIVEFLADDINENPQLVEPLLTLSGGAFASLLAKLHNEGGEIKVLSALLYNQSLILNSAQSIEESEPSISEEYNLEASEPSLQISALQVDIEDSVAINDEKINTQTTEDFNISCEPVSLTLDTVTPVAQPIEDEIQLNIDALPNTPEQIDISDISLNLEPIIVEEKASATNFDLSTPKNFEFSAPEEQPETIALQVINPHAEHADNSNTEDLTTDEIPAVNLEPITSSNFSTSSMDNSEGLFLKAVKRNVVKEETSQSDQSALKNNEEKSTEDFEFEADIIHLDDDAYKPNTKYDTRHFSEAPKEILSADATEAEDDAEIDFTESKNIFKQHLSTRKAVGISALSLSAFAIIAFHEQFNNPVINAVISSVDRLLTS